MELFKIKLKKILKIFISALGILWLLLFFFILFPLAILIIVYCIDDVYHGNFILGMPLKYQLFVLGSLVTFISALIMNMISLKRGFELISKENPCKKEIISFVLYFTGAIILTGASIILLLF